MMAQSHFAVRDPSEPYRDEDPRNALLDAFDAQVRAMIDNGFEPQLRARLAKHLPAQPPRADLFAPPPVPDACAGALRQAGALGLTALIGELRRLEKLKLTKLAWEAVTAIKAHAEAALAAEKNAASQAVSEA